MTELSVMLRSWLVVHCYLTEVQKGSDAKIGYEAGFLQNEYEIVISPLLFIVCFEGRMLPCFQRIKESHCPGGRGLLRPLPYFVIWNSRVCLELAECPNPWTV